MFQLYNFRFQERLFFILANELIKIGRIPGVISGGKKASKATYIPHSYAKAQSSWADNFYQQNSYLINHRKLVYSYLINHRKLVMGIGKVVH